MLFSKKLSLDPTFLKEDVKNSHKMQKMLKKLGNKTRISEIQKLLSQIRDQKRKEIKPPLVLPPSKKLKEEETLQCHSQRSNHPPHFSLKNIQNISFQNKAIDKTLELDEYEFLQRKASADIILDQARSFLNKKRPTAYETRILITQSEENSENPFKALKRNSPVLEEDLANSHRLESKREENFIMNYSRSNNLKTSLINKKRNETITQRLSSQKLPGLQRNNNEQKSCNRLITDFISSNNGNNYSLDQKDSLTNNKPEPLFKLKTTMVLYPPKQRIKNPIESLKIKTENMIDFLNSLENDKFRKTMEIFKLSLAGGDDNPQKANAGFKNSMNFGYVGYLLKSDYFAKQEKKDYLNNNNQYPNKKFYFFKPDRKKKADVPTQKKKPSDFNDFLYEMDPCTSPNTLGRGIKEFTNFLKTNKDVEKQRKMLDFVGKLVRKEGKDYYNQNLNWKNEELSIRKESQRDFSSSKALKQEIFDFYYSLTDYHENDAELKGLKENLLSSFRDYDQNFRQINEELIKNNDYLRKIDNEKKIFKYERENFD